MRETPLEVSLKYVHGITWPVTKPVLIEAMERNGAPPDVLAAMHESDKTRFVSPAAVQMVLWVRA